MRRSRSFLGMLLAVALTVALGACTRPETDEPRGRELNIGAATEPAGLDMITTTGAGTPFVLLYNVYETLVKLDNEGNIRPLLASEWSQTPDRLSYTFSLDPAAKFASGAPVDADAVVKSFERARGETATESIRLKWAPVDTIEAVDQRTVRLNLSRPSNGLLYDLTGPTGTISDPTATADLNTTPAGSGPYKFVTWEQGSRVELEANAGYWGTPARFSPVNFRYFADPNAMNTAMLSGQLDMISNLTVPQSIGQFSDAEKYTIHEGTTDGEVVLGFNHANEALSDVRVRQAISHAIDRQALVDSVWGGKGMLIGSMVPPTDPWFEDLSGVYPYDPDKARELLAEAGYASGLTLRLRVPNLPYGPTSGRFIAAQLKDVGITAEVEELEWARWLDQVYGQHDYDMTVVAHVEPRDLGAFAAEGNYWGYRNDAFNTLLTEADTGTEADQTEKLKEAARMLTDDAAAVWLFLLPSITIATPAIAGVQDNQISLSFDLTTLAARS